MGGAEKAAGATRDTGEAQEAEAVGGGFEGHKGSHEEALGGVSQGSTGCCKIETAAQRVAAKQWRPSVSAYCPQKDGVPVIIQEAPLGFAEWADDDNAIGLYAHPVQRGSIGQP